MSEEKKQKLKEYKKNIDRQKSLNIIMNKKAFLIMIKQCIIMIKIVFNYDLIVYVLLIQLYIIKFIYLDRLTEIKVMYD